MDNLTHENTPLKITGIGSALVDILLQESEQFLAASGAQKGGMTLVDNEVIERILSKTSQKPAIVPGGSACNTLVGIGKIGYRDIRIAIVIEVFYGNRKGVVSS